MKNLFLIALVSLMTACAAPVKPTWQQELENIDRQWSDPVPVTPPPKKIERPADGLALILQAPAADHDRMIEPIKPELCDWRGEY